MENLKLQLRTEISFLSNEELSDNLSVSIGQMICLYDKEVSDMTPEFTQKIIKAIFNSYKNIFIHRHGREAFEKLVNYAQEGIHSSGFVDRMKKIIDDLED
jgi:hypothetical protein